MNNTIKKILLIIGVLGATVFAYLKWYQPPSSIINNNEETTSEQITQEDGLNMNPSLDVVTPGEEEPEEIISVQPATPAQEEAEVVSVDNEPLVDLQEYTVEPPVLPAAPKPAPAPTAEKPKAATMIPAQKPQTKEEKLNRFNANMEDMQKKASEEWEKMTPEERQLAEKQVAIFQETFQQEIERLSKLTPEEVELEKKAAMDKLKEENPAAYENLKSMEEMFSDLEDVE